MNKLLALIAIAFFLPLMFLIGLLIWVIDGSPLLFTQERVGQNMRAIDVLKFRTFEGKEVTRTGKWLRASGLDELPQLFSIVRGDMNVVGPRPLTWSDIERLGYLNKEDEVRWNVKPGMTGFAQLFGGENGGQSLALDKKYIKEKGLLLDTELVLITFLMNAFGKKRVRNFNSYRLLRKRYAM